MEKRTRSPNYPALSLPAAIEKVAALYKSQHTHPAPREVAVKSMGYAGLSGASATAISAVGKYGLLDRIGDGIKVSELAMQILHPRTPAEKTAAIHQAAKEPELFRELSEKFPGRLPSDEVLRNHLIRSGFSPNAVSAAILAYRETIEFAHYEPDFYDSSSGTIIEMKTQPPMLSSKAEHPTTRLVANELIEHDKLERPIARYDFEGGGYVRIVMGGDVPTAKALKMAETLLKLKQEELKEAPPAVVTVPQEGAEDE